LGKSLLRKAAALNPDDSDLAYNICSQLFSALKFIHRYEEAIEIGKTALKRLKASNPHNGYSTNIHMMIADTQREMGLLDDMERDLRAAINEFPGDQSLSLKLADLLFESGRIQETDAVIKSLIKSNTDLGALLKVIGDFYDRKCQPEKAFQYYLDAYNQNEYLIDRSLFETLAIFYEKRLNLKEALKINQRLLEFYKSSNIKGYYLYRVQQNIDRLQSAPQ
jgi:tetratricopeptide (TPR) repeat protein